MVSRRGHVVSVTIFGYLHGGLRCYGVLTVSKRFKSTPYLGSVSEFELFDETTLFDRLK
jgi:hypothetical protein